MAVPPHPGALWRRLINMSGRTQTWVARQMGISTKHLNQIVREKITPTAQVTVRFARVMECDPFDLHGQAARYEVHVALEKDRADRCGNCQRPFADVGESLAIEGYCLNCERAVKAMRDEGDR